VHARSQALSPHGGRESERVLAPLTGLGNTLASVGHHTDAIPLLQRAVAITRARFGMFDLRQQDALKTLAASLTAMDRQPEAQDLKRSRRARRSLTMSAPVAAALNVPMRVYYPTPQIVAHVPTLAAAVDTESRYVQTAFTVAADGGVRDAHIVDHDTRDRYARDILKAVRDSRFRPKFVDGHPVAATGITYRQVFWTAKPRE
jgi:hypothetical protein